LNDGKKDRTVIILSYMPAGLKILALLTAPPAVGAAPAFRLCLAACCLFFVSFYCDCLLKFFGSLYHDLCNSNK